MIEEAEEKSEYWTSGESNYIILDVLRIKVHLYKSNPLKIAGFSPLPSKLQKRYSKMRSGFLISPPSRDFFCVIWCLSIFLVEEKIAKDNYTLLQKSLRKISNSVLTESWLHQNYGATFSDVRKRAETRFGYMCIFLEGQRV